MLSWLRGCQYGAADIANHKSRSAGHIIGVTERGRNMHRLDRDWYGVRIGFEDLTFQILSDGYELAYSGSLAKLVLDQTLTHLRLWSGLHGI